MDFAKLIKCLITFIFIAIFDVTTSVLASPSMDVLGEIEQKNLSETLNDVSLTKMVYYEGLSEYKSTDKQTKVVDKRCWVGISADRLGIRSLIIFSPTYRLSYANMIPFAGDVVTIKDLPAQESVLRSKDWEILSKKELTWVYEANFGHKLSRSRKRITIEYDRDGSLKAVNEEINHRYAKLITGYISHPCA